jgi:hypothetical protein
MFKRFHDTEKWKLPWYRKLTTGEKAAWDYVTSNCDNVGVWVPDYELADFSIGDAIDWAKFAESCNGNIVILKNGKWWIVDFCKFQYSELDEKSTSKPIISYVKLLKSHGLWESYLENQRVIEGFGKVIDTAQDKEKDKEQDKEQDKDIDKDSTPKETKHVYGKERNVKLTDRQYNHFKDKYGESNANEMIEELGRYKALHGKTYKRDDIAIENWVAKKVMDRVKSTTTPNLPPPTKEFMDNYESNYGSHT